MGVPPPNMNQPMPSNLQFQQLSFPTVSTPDEDLRMPSHEQPTVMIDRINTSCSRLAMNDKSAGEVALVNEENIKKAGEADLEKILNGNRRLMSRKKSVKWDSRLMLYLKLLMVLFSSLSVLTQGLQL